MKDPQRLLEDGATELELALLQAGDAEGPSVKARQTALAALGLSGVVLGASSPAAAAAGGTALSTSARVLAAKWWAMGALITASGAAGLGYAAWHDSSVTAPGPSTVARRSPEPLVSSPVAERPAPDVSALPSPVTTTQRDRPPVPQPRSSANLGIQEQIALIDRARGAVAARQTAAAMSALDEYQRRFPGGVLAQEATLLRIETLLARGDKTSATHLGQQFLQRYPRSPMAARVKTLIDG